MDNFHERCKNWQDATHVGAKVLLLKVTYDWSFDEDIDTDPLVEDSPGAD